MEMPQFLRYLDEAATFLTLHVRDPNDTPRQARDKIRKRVIHAIKAGELFLTRTSPESDEGSFSLPHLVAWARVKWPGKLDAFPASSTKHSQDAAGICDTPCGDVLPGNIDVCRQSLQSAFNAIRSQNNELLKAKVEINRLEAIEAKYLAWCVQNQENARKPRKE